MVYNFLSPNGGGFNHQQDIVDIFDVIRTTANVNEIDRLAQAAITITRGLPAQWAATNVYIDCGLILDERGMLAESAGYLGMATKAGEQFPDFGAVTWTFGNQQYRLRQNECGYRSLLRASDDFAYRLNLGRNPQNGQMHPLKNHYTGRLAWMEDQLICTVEHAYEVFNPFPPGRMVSAAYKRLADRLSILIRCGQFGEARQVIDQLDAHGLHAPNREEQILAQVRCGMALWQMGNQDLAIRRFLNAAGCYTGTLQHQGALTRWMLGIVEWEDPRLEGDAIAQWERACALTERLERRADERNEQVQRLWYAERIQRMGRMIMRRIERRDIP